jgi:hypothetical protein
MKKLISVLLMTLATTAWAKDSVYQYSPEVQFGYSDTPCENLNNPDNYPLKEAWAFAPKTGETIHGCALVYDNIVEMQLHGIFKRNNVDESIDIHQKFNLHLFTVREPI